MVAAVPVLPYGQVVRGHDHPEVITRLLAAHGMFVYEVSAIRPTLESYFLELTGHRPALPEDPAQRGADQTAEHLRDVLDGESA